MGIFPIFKKNQINDIFYNYLIFIIVVSYPVGCRVLISLWLMVIKNEESKGYIIKF